MCFNYQVILIENKITHIHVTISGAAYFLSYAKL